MTKAFQILGIAGSLRKKSDNTGLLQAAQKVLPPNVQLEQIKKLLAALVAKIP